MSGYKMSERSSEFISIDTSLLSAYFLIPSPELRRTRVLGAGCQRKRGLDRKEVRRGHGAS